MKRSLLSLLTVWMAVLTVAGVLGLPPSKSAAAGTNLLLGKSYSASIAADASYPDTGNAELTNGTYASALLADAAWQGRFNAATYSFTVDLGSAQSFQNFKSDFYKYTGAGVQTPTQVQYSSSTDNVNYTAACTVSQQGSGSDIVSVPYTCSAPSTISARYVRMTVTSAASTWSFIDEWEVTPASLSTAARLNGTFLQPDLANTWTSTQWNTEYQKMIDVGINQMVLQWTANSKSSTTVYPTTALSGYTQNTSSDIVSKVLSQGNTYGVDTYLGLQLNEDWFGKYANDNTWLTNEANLAKTLAGDLYAKYGSNASLKGFYLSFEVDNWNFPTSTEWSRMNTFYQTVAGYIKSLNPSLKVMISPFYNTSGGQTTSGWQTMWEAILPNSSLDILALQDGVGAGHAVTSQLASWFAATKAAITNARPSMALWDDAETFNLDFQPMDLSTLVADMNAAASYVTNYLSFSFNHYISPQQVNPLYYTTYQNYVQSGSMDASAPTTPTGLASSSTTSISTHLSWTASTDGTGVVGYKIYRNNEIVSTSYSAGTTFDDSQLNSSTTYTYKVQAFDAAGNNSAISSQISVTTLAGTSYPTNLASGKTYTTTLAADASYPDSGGELTNGSFGTTTYSDAAWQGRNTGSTYSFTIDLGSSKSIKEISADFLQVKSVFILLPKSVTFSTSANNTAFTQVGVVNKPAVSSSDQTKTYKVAGLSSVSGRYVKVTVEPASSAWTFIDEIQVRQ
ncbi:F5/8 type C domain-containing protein [Paenibacillus taihuensis]|uniref:F5/8 type C domain-containing protein n=1 Tax=Paenibacillus taihuensis TaxID=1156355 RepID=A0A3D9Q691_9BACL|nr:DUF4434 domain-containing protein [Paenibacillus taihuensis]REE55447.1 F5/8 type C domain-containing protein [Paenibacillus taihuensis]